MRWRRKDCPERREREMGRGVQPIGIGCVQASVVTG